MPSTPAHSKQKTTTRAPPSIISTPPTVVAAAPTFGQSIKEGVGLGIGSAIGSRIVSGIFGPPAIEVKHQPTPYEQCLALHKEDPGVCAPLAQSGQPAQTK